MLPTAADFAARTQNLRAILFTEFTVVATVAALAIALGGRRLSGRARERVVVGASLALIAWFAGLLPATVFVGWAAGLYVAVELGTASRVGRAVTALVVVGLVVAPVLAIGALGDGPPHAREFVAFGTNIVIFRAIAYARERWRGELARVPFDRVLLSLLFFPTFVNGPVESPRAQLASALAPATGDDMRAALLRIGRGVAKILAVGWALPANWTSALAGAPEASAATLWLWAVGLYVWFYLCFSAWADVAIGLGRLCGRAVVENFDRPWQARDPGDFWRRWNVSLGLWLRDYVYIPLGGNRRHRALNVAVVFVVSAAWHVWGSLKLLGFGFYPIRAWYGFLLWGALHTIAVVVAGRPATARGRIAQAATFLFASLAWVPFFLPAGVSFPDALRLLARMIVPIVP
jgi:D-alanyl-lipoteichoic acid acyltransferase DltB (MBOAT superfamily)